MSIARRILPMAVLIGFTLTVDAFADCCHDSCLGCKTTPQGFRRCAIGDQYLNCDCDSSSGDCVFSGGLCQTPPSCQLALNDSGVVVRDRSTACAPSHDLRTVVAVAMAGGTSPHISRLSARADTDNRPSSSIKGTVSSRPATSGKARDAAF